MQPNGVPQPPRKLTKEALAKEFSYSFNRAELNVIYNLISQFPINMSYGQLKSPAFMDTLVAMEGVMSKIKGAVTALSDQDYEPIEQPHSNGEKIAI